MSNASRGRRIGKATKCAGFRWCFLLLLLLLLGNVSGKGVRRRLLARESFVVFVGTRFFFRGGGGGGEARQVVAVFGEHRGTDARQPDTPAREENDGVMLGCQ